MKLIEIKWIEVSNSQKKQTPITATEKNSCENMKWKMIWKKKSSSFNNPALFWYHKKMNNNEKKWIVIKFGLTYLKRTSLCTWKVHIPFLSTTLQNTAQSRAKNAFFASKIKKLSNNYWPKWFWKKAILVFLQ